MRTPGLLRAIRERPRVHWLALALAVILGLLLAWRHWLGLVAGGGLVGLVSTSVRRALLAGLGFGLTVLVVWLGALAVDGSLGEVLAMGELVLLGGLVGVGGAVLGSLLRGVV